MVQGKLLQRNVAGKTVAEKCCRGAGNRYDNSHYKHFSSLTQQ
jgi:hypothetical protein